MLTSRLARSFMMAGQAQRGFYKAAVILAGNGVYDGSECTEAVALLVGLSRQGAQVTCFAPDRAQAHAVNHTNGQEHQGERNVM